MSTPSELIAQARELAKMWPNEWKTDANDRLGFRVFTNSLTENSYSLIASVPSPFAAELIALVPSLVGALAEAEGKLSRIRESTLYVCGACGYSAKNRAGWCGKGCGSDYNRLFIISGAAILEEEGS